MKKILFVFASVFLFYVLAIYLNQEKDPRVRIGMGHNSYMDDVTIAQKKEGVVRWIINAKRALFLTETDISLKDLKIVFPEKELTLTSEGGLYDVRDRTLKIDGNIKASTKDYDITARSLFWDPATNEITSDARVQIKGKRFFVEGDTLAATSDKARLTNNVRAVFDGK